MPVNNVWKGHTEREREIVDGALSPITLKGSVVSGKNTNKMITKASTLNSNNNNNNINSFKPGVNYHYSVLSCPTPSPVEDPNR